MKHFIKRFLIGVAAVTGLFLPTLVFAVIVSTNVGGTGTSTTPGIGQVVIGNGTTQAYLPTSTNGYALEASSGAPLGAAWVAVAAGGVTSITGTANQILASTSTGAITLSIPSPLIVPGANFTTITATTSITDAGTLNVSGAVNESSTENVQGAVNDRSTLLVNATETLPLLTNTILGTDGSGNIIATSVAAGGTPAGSSYQIQYNNGGAFGATSTIYVQSSTPEIVIGSNQGNYQSLISIYHIHL